MDGVRNINGWYQTIKAADLDSDGNIDSIIGNWDENNKFHPTIKNRCLFMLIILMITRALGLL
jgi:hypothetical protein